MAYKGGGAGGGTTATGNGGNGKGKTATSNGAVVKERVKSIGYSATVNKLLLDVEADTTEGSVKEGAIGDLMISNTGSHPTFAILAYRLWTDATTMTGTTYHVNYLLKPGEEMYVPDTPAVIADETIEQLAGTAVTNSAPSVTANFAYSDSGTTIDDATFEDSDTSVTVDDGDYFRVNDLIQFGINNVTATKIEICRITAISTNLLTLERALFGTTANDKDAQTHATSGVVDNAKVYFPFFNTYHDHDKYTVAQTDSNGKFKAANFFGEGKAGTHLQGLTPGSVAIKFYEPGYQGLGLSGITSGTSSGLTASTEYKLDITVDGGTLFQDLSITTDSSNLNFGGSLGVVSKIQAALDTQYYTAGNLFEKKVHVGIVNGDIRFTSGSHLSTSAILLADTGDSGSLIDAAANGRIPASGNVPSAVAARLPDDTLYDKVTYAASPNEGAFLFDDGYGRLWGVGTGTINYETGAIDMIGCPVNAEFVYSCLHTSAFSGKRNSTDAAKMNSLKAIYGNMPNQKGSGQLTVTRL